MSFIRKPFRWSYSNAAIIIVCINIIVFIFQLVSKDYITNYLALNPLNIIFGNMYWQFVTYMFIHGGISHILFNMLALFIFGTALERYIGSKEFVLYYMLTGAFAGILSFCVYVLTGSNYVFLMGASGALFAVQLAYAAYFPNTYIYFWGIFPLRAPIMVIVFTAIELFSGIFGVSNGTAHATHLFGFLAGVLYFFIRWRSNPFRLMFKR